MTKDKNQSGGTDSLINEMVIHSDDRSTKAGLVVEPEASPEKDKFEIELERTLRETESQVLGLGTVSSDPSQTKAWQRAREVVANFRPVPWFIWRLSNYVFIGTARGNKVSEGFVLGLRRLLFAAASDPILGSGEKVNDLKRALKILSPDVVAAVAVIHAVCRRLSTRQYERIWRPILDDAILRCNIGCYVGQYDMSFGRGRGMLAGFASRAGLAILLATGELEQARKALESLATGREIGEVGHLVYQCDPLQVSAMMLSAAGCGRDASFGTVSYAYKNAKGIIENDDQMRWLSAFTITEQIRMNRSQAIEEEYWRGLHMTSPERRNELIDITKVVIRRGHAWNWLV